MRQRLPKIGLRATAYNDGDVTRLLELAHKVCTDDLYADDGTLLKDEYVGICRVIQHVESGGWVGFLEFWPEDGFREVVGAGRVQVYQRADYHPIVDPLRLLAPPL